uniref:Nuclear pore complex protein Nup85 n=2 Tax=Proconiini TaxID=565685 RepID=A0A1B6GHG6_9HEMI
MDDARESYFTTVLPEKVFEEAGITAQWLGIGRVGVHTYKKPTQKVDSESTFAPCEAKVYHLRTDTVLFDPIVRKLVNESNATFISGQKITSSAGARPETLRLSIQYRSIIRACIEDLQKESMKPNKEMYQQYVSIFYNIEFIWHLTEILLVNALPGDIVLPHLREWMRFHFPSGDLLASQIVKGRAETGAEARHSDYWPTVITLILQGSIDSARTMLKLHSQCDSDVFLEADKVLGTMPEYSVYGGLSVSEFNARFSSWQAELINKVNAGVFSSSKNLLNIMKMISGESVLEMKQYCSTWYELMVASLLYTEPTVKSFDLSFHANKCIMQFGGAARLSLTDHIVLSLLECNLHDVIKKLQSTCDSGWAAAHLTNLLFHCGRLNVIDNKIMSGMPQRIDEELVLEYGTLLMSHKSLWQAGVSYLDHCPTLGAPRLHLLLPRLNPRTEARANKIIQIALDRNMPDVAAGVCKVEGMKSLKRRRLGHALNWALQSQDSGFAAFLADKVLEFYAREGVLGSLDLLDNLGSCMLVCDRLTFLGKYCEFHQVYRSGELKKAAGLLVSLLASKICPKYFWLTLLTDALPLLETQDTPVFSYKDTCELIACLEELVMEGSDHPRSAPLSDDKNRLIRLALTKNLVRACVHDPSHCV